MAGTKYYKVTKKELYALIAVADTVDAMKGCGDEGIEFVRDYSNTEIKC